MDRLIVVVSGSREIRDARFVFDELDRVIDSWRTEVFHQSNLPVHVFHGDAARGVDPIADVWAQIRGYTFKRMPANWTAYGRPAGHRRNREMLDVACPHLVVAIWDGKSPGTRGMIEEARSRSLNVEVVRWTG